tara:strand:- start:111 stop:245 length:135 start_codon:yes stop_codon:yes gene_type:complete
MKNKYLAINNNFSEEFKTKNKYQLVDNYWMKRKKECEKYLSKFC